MKLFKDINIKNDEYNIDLTVDNCSLYCTIDFINNGTRYLFVIRLTHYNILSIGTIQHDHLVKIIEELEIS